MAQDDYVLIDPSGEWSATDNLFSQADCIACYFYGDDQSRSFTLNDASFVENYHRALFTNSYTLQVTDLTANNIIKTVDSTFTPILDKSNMHTVLSLSGLPVQN